MDKIKPSRLHKSGCPACGWQIAARSTDALVEALGEHCEATGCRIGQAARVFVITDAPLPAAAVRQ